MVWISDDGDFTGSKSGEFHPDLLAEAEAAGVADRIALFPNTGALAIELLRSNGLSAELPKARLELCEKTVREFVAKRVLPGLVDGDDTDLGDLATTSWEPAGDIEVETQGRVETGTVWAFTAPVRLTMEGLGGVTVDSALRCGRSAAWQMSHEARGSPQLLKGAQVSHTRPALRSRRWPQPQSNDELDHACGSWSSRITHTGA